jgi:hypothetical protein
LLDARGFDAVEARVRNAWEKWCGDGAHVFRPIAAAGHDRAVKCDWVMTALPSGDTAARGLSFLLLGCDGRLRADYQFNPVLADAADLAARYLGLWNDHDRDRDTRRSIAELWRPDGLFIDASGNECSIAALGDAMSAGRRETLVPAGRSHRHHDVAAIHWRREGATSHRGGTGADLLIFDEGGRIRRAYRFDDSI